MASPQGAVLDGSRVLFQVFIAAHERKAVGKILAHFIGVHLKLTPIVNKKIFASGLIFLYCGLAY